MSWPVTVRVEYTPGALRWPLQEAFALPAAWRETPSLKSVLHEQFPGLITTDEGAAPVSEFEAELGYGEPLVLRTRDAGGTPLATLWVHAGASTP
ncbi:MAG TPA: hypothetical protein VMK65_02535 [Longimicrobiales bacterium]|nr:hypothetical protein [Longimicrobiales bacterium]